MGAPMLYVSIIVELLRARPALAIWIAALLQAVVWTLVPALFYSAPPGDVATVLAVGHQFRLGTYLGPPLAFWLAELAYDAGGLFGVYALSQACVVATYWAVFSLGRTIVGAQQGALAVLLMVGISAFTVSTPDFGPVMLTMPLWALILLHYWLAVGENRRSYWIVLAVEIALLLLTTYAGLLLVALLLVFTFANRHARSALASSDPWVAGIVTLVVMLPHLLWLANSSEGLLPTLSRLRTPESVGDNFIAWLRQIGLILAAHAGVALLVVGARGRGLARQEPAPVIVRNPVGGFAKSFVFYFAVVPPLVATFLGVLLGSGPVGGVAPLLVLSGLAVIVAAGDAVPLRHQRGLIYAWFGLLLVPPLTVVVALATLPWLGGDLNVAQPADAMARFFADNFQRRVGSPLPIVAGDPRLAAIIAAGAPSRPSLLLDAAPEHSPWVSFDDVRAKGAIVVWRSPDTAGVPPPEIQARFPDLTPEVPRAFERKVQGSLSLLRIGWAVIRPQSPAAPPSGAQ
jgi:hypothetical protein